MICGVCLLDLMLNVRERITGDAYNIERMIYRVKPADHNGVGIIADNVNACYKQRIHAGLSTVNRIHRGIIVICDAVTIAVGRSHEILNVNIGRRKQDNKAQQNYKYYLSCLALLFLLLSALSLIGRLRRMRARLALCIVIIIVVSFGCAAAVILAAVISAAVCMLAALFASE